MEAGRRLLMAAWNSPFATLRNRLVELQYDVLLKSAKKRSIQVELTMEEFSVVTSADCFYCWGSLPFAGYGLDRKDSSGGYTLENVVPCCKICNRIKSDILTSRQMFEMRDHLAQRRFDAILRSMKRAVPNPQPVRSYRGQHPKPRVEFGSWYITTREYRPENSGIFKRKTVRVRLGSSTEMDATQAQKAADAYLENLNGGRLEIPKEASGDFGVN